ncbi:MAG: glucose-6-phosphate dehydrogenase [bacterium]|nr:glucose-6-phosphate dehydrogenase [bacterium]
MSEARTNIPTVLVVLGATGDLAAKKIFPALLSLHKKKLLPKSFKVIGFARRKLKNSTFQDHIWKALKRYGGAKNKSDIKAFLKMFSFESGDLGVASQYQGLAQRVKAIDEEWGLCSNKLFYLAVPPNLYQKTFKHLSASDLTELCSPEEGWTRVLVEKPFGKDRHTASELDILLAKLFKEEQIYRIDHYLAKEMLQNILAFRFSNNLFEGTWNNQFVEKIKITALETLGLKGRGNFYDGLGALKDVGQNHLLQMLALITMDHPETLKSDAIRKERARVLATLIAPSGEDVKERTYRAQFEGYRKIENVKPGSKTETYFKAGFFLNHPRWQGVPITIEAGKEMPEVKKEIEVVFKHPLPCLCPPGSEHFKNSVTFHLEPFEGIKVKFWSKRPGHDYEIEEKDLNVRLRDVSEKSQYVEEYEKLLLDCIAGDQTLFVSTDEVREMWRFTDPIVEGWEKGVVPLRAYKIKTDQALKESVSVDEHLLESTLVPESKYTKGRTVAVVGLGKMGSNIARRLKDRGWRVVGYNRTEKVTRELEDEGIAGAYSYAELARKLPRPRVIWLMLSAGKLIDEVLFSKEGLIQYLAKGDVIIDGGNSHFKDSKRRHAKLKEKGIHFVDAGVSGGPYGALRGSTIMVGGSKTMAHALEALFNDLAQENGYEFFNQPGAGHFVKMIHNGIEYGMMQAIAEGFTIMENAPYKLNLSNVARVYNQGSVIESRLMGWLQGAFEIYGENLHGVSGKVGHTGEGSWTVQTAKELKLKAKIIEGSFKFRKMSEKDPSYTGKILSALRNQFGGHSVN